MKGRTKTQKGITLIALIITIVVLLILAAVAISSITNDGILQYAQNSGSKYNQSVANEQQTLKEYTNYLENAGSSTGGNVETITTAIDYVGSYVDLDNNGSPDGIIYIDKAQTVSGSWNGSSYTVTNVTTGLKDYEVVSEECTTDEFGTAKLLRAVAGSTGEERFYVMALTDVNPGTYYYWYDAAYDDGISDYSTVTATGVGTGETNTATMLTKWNAETYGTKNAGTYADMWGVVEDGWYIPSKDEWVAFGSTLGITSSNYGEKGLRDQYFSSSLGGANYACIVRFDLDTMNDGGLSGGDYCVRLGTTF